MTDTVTTSAEAGSLSDLQREGRLLARSARCRSWSSGTSGRALRDRGSLPAPRVPAAPGHGRGRARHLPLAPRPLRSRVGLHARPLGRRRARLRRRAVDGDAVLVAPARDGAIPSGGSSGACATASSRASRSSSPRRCSGCSKPAVPRAEIVRTRHRLRRTLPRATDGVPGSPCSSRWPTCSRPLDPPTDAGARARAGVRQPGHARRRAPLRRSAARAPTTLDRRSAGRLVPALRRDPCVGRGRARAGDRVHAGASLADVEAHDVRRRHRPRLHRRAATRSTSRTRRSRRSVMSAPSAAAVVLPTLVRQTARRARSEEVARVAPSPRPRRRSRAEPRPRCRPHMAADARGDGELRRRRRRSAWRLLDDDPEQVVGALLDAIRAGATPEQLGRALAYAAALRITRFHVQNDLGDWDTVHHAFTAANALHQALRARADAGAAARRSCTARCASTSTASSTSPRRACRPSTTATSTSSRECWEVQGAVDEAGADRLRVPPWRRRRGRAGRRARARARSARTPSSTGSRSYEAGAPAGRGVARGIRGGRAHPHRPRAVPRRAHADPARAARPSCASRQRLRRGEALYEEG